MSAAKPINREERSPYLAALLGGLKGLSDLHGRGRLARRQSGLLESGTQEVSENLA